MHRTRSRINLFAAVVLALLMVVAMAGPSAAGYCLKQSDKYVVCV